MAWLWEVSWCGDMHSRRSARGRSGIKIGPANRIPQPTPGGGRSLYVALFVAALMLFGFDVANFRIAESVRGIVTDVSRPVLETMSRSISSVRSALRTTRDYSELASRYEVLRTENRQLKSLRSEAYIVRARAIAYEKLLDYVPEDGSESIAARTIADQNSPFARSVIVNAGTGRGVSNGSAVLGETGLIGRVVSTGRTTSRVLLVTDLNSRIPVFVGARKYRALLAGTNGPALSLMYLPASAMLKSGDPVITSGEGRLLPQGLHIGQVRQGLDGINDVTMGQPPREADIVRILKYDARIDVDPATPLPVALMAIPKPVAATTGSAGANEVQTAVAVKAADDPLPVRE